MFWRAALIAVVALGLSGAAAAEKAECVKTKKKKR
jgi:hypothetical protein